MSLRDQIEACLRDEFDPTDLTVVDDSDRHRGHAGYREGGDSHFNVRMRSAKFKGQSRIARHRAVHAALGPQLVASIHALALDLDV